jgi:hypothetical protein
VYKSATISPTILAHLIMAKWTETWCGIKVLNKGIKCETLENYII